MVSLFRLNGIFVFTFIFFFVLFSADAEYREYKKTGISLGTVLSVTFFADSKNNDKNNKLLENVFNSASIYEKKFSSKDPESLLYMINKRGGGTVADDDLLLLVNKSLDIAEDTNGYFDPCLNILIKLWDLEHRKEPPSQKSVEAARKLSGSKLISVNGKNLLLNGAEIDLGAIAKGEILGKMASQLTVAGVKDYVINGGGDLAVGGLYAGKREWNIAIANPYDKSKYAGIMLLKEISVVTSGNYERFFKGSDGKIYHHILNPFTGYPAESGVDSVTVTAKKPETADALATAFFVMGMDKTFKFLKDNSNYKDVNVIFIYKENNRIKYRYSDGLTSEKNDEYGMLFRLK